MKQIYIDTYKGTFHPCDILSFKHNRITDIFSIYFYDRANGIYSYANLEKINKEFFIKDIHDLSDKNAFSRLISSMQHNADISLLPPFLKSVNHRTITNKDVYVETKAMHAFKVIQRLEFLELKSYCDAIEGPIYYYFIIKDMEPNINGFYYKLKLSKISHKSLKKNIIARHTTTKSLNDLLSTDLYYYYTYDKTEKIDIDLDSERVLINKIIELNRGRRKNLDTELLTKVVRIILSEEDRIKAAREYQVYLSTYYDKWVEERKYIK